MLGSWYICRFCTALRILQVQDDQEVISDLEFDPDEVIYSEAHSDGSDIDIFGEDLHDEVFYSEDLQSDFNGFRDCVENGDDDDDDNFQEDERDKIDEFVYSEDIDNTESDEIADFDNGVFHQQMGRPDHGEDELKYSEKADIFEPMLVAPIPLCDESSGVSHSRIRPSDTDSRSVRLLQRISALPSEHPISVIQLEPRQTRLSHATIAGFLARVVLHAR